MKNLFLFLMLIYQLRATAQPPNQFNYQAVARNTMGQNIPNAKISLRISILDGGTTGTSVYSETRQTTTNQMGLFTAAIGGPGAVNTSGNFATINWSTGQKFIRVEVDPLGGNNFTVLGNTEMLSVPYALYAVNSKPGTPGPANVLNIGTVTTAAPGLPAAASITGTSPLQTLNLALPAGTAGKNALIKVTPEPAGTNCAAGGNRIESGLDNDGNNILNTGEITSTQYVCNAVSTATIDGWGTRGNAATNPAINFIGTTDNQPLRFKVNNTWAGEIHPTSSNTFIGLNSGQANTKGAFNTASGDHALFSNTEGIYNAAMGFNALRSNTTGGSNAAFGSGAMYSNVSGLYNSAFGAAALYDNVSGMYNTASGAEALYNNTTGGDNTASGYSSLFANTTGNDNTAFGAGGLQANKTGKYNTAIGSSVLLQNNGDNNTASGVNALASNWNGGSNTATGMHALGNNTNGNNNTAVGYGALLNNNTGNNNIAVGWNAGIDYNLNTPHINNTISIGNDDLLNGSSNQAFIGNTSTVWIGGMVPWKTYSDARMKNNIKEDVQGLPFILKLRPVTYNISIRAINSLTGNKASPDFQGKYDTEKITYTGFLAQEVEAAANAVHYNFSGYSKPTDKNGLYSLSYEQFVVPLVKAVQEQQAMIIQQQKQIDLLEKKLTDLLSR